MFQRWGFLLCEIWGLLVLAALLGLLAGWLIWARRGADQSGTARIATLEAELAACQARLAANDNETGGFKGELLTMNAPAAKAPPPKTPAAAPPPPPPPAPPPTPTAKPVAVAASATPGKPKTLAAARDGKADDLKQIKGIGPKLEQLCHKLGFYHFDQIAAWSDSEIAWVDDNLEGFKGRVTRDNWVPQARALAAGAAPDA